MNIETLVKTSTVAVRITSLDPGTVYKRAYKRNTYDSSLTLSFGVIQDVMNNGSETVVTAIEITSGYRPEVELRTFSSGDDLAIFPATPDELDQFMSDVNDGLERAVRTAEEALWQAKQKHEQAQIIDRQNAVNELNATPTEPAATTDSTDD